MKVTQVLGIVLVVSVLGGCATPHRPMSDTLYRELALDWGGDYLCGVAGYMDAKTVADGRAKVANTLHFFDDVDAARLDREINKVMESGSKPTKEYCFGRAVVIAEFVGNGVGGSQSNTGAVPPVTVNRPITTYCNRMSGNTFCSSF